MRIASFLLVRIEQFAGHLMEQSRIVEHFFDLLLRTAVVEKCLHLIGGYAECLRHVKQVVIVRRRIYAEVAVIWRLAPPPMLIAGSRCKCPGSDTAIAVNLQYLALLRF